MKSMCILTERLVQRRNRFPEDYHFGAIWSKFQESGTMEIHCWAVEEFDQLGENEESGKGQRHCI